jgi:hypothetical protein
VRRFSGRAMPRRAVKPGSRNFVQLGGQGFQCGKPGWVPVSVSSGGCVTRSCSTQSWARSLR